MTGCILAHVNRQGGGCSREDFVTETLQSSQCASTLGMSSTRPRRRGSVSRSRARRPWCGDRGARFGDGEARARALRPEASMCAPLPLMAPSTSRHMCSATQHPRTGWSAAVTRAHGLHLSWMVRAQANRSRAWQTSSRRREDLIQLPPSPRPEPGPHGVSGRV
jgi:hypothetical protein